MVFSRAWRRAVLRRRLSLVVAGALVLGVTVALPARTPRAAADEEVLQQVAAAVDSAGTDPNALMAALPASVTEGHQWAFQAALSGSGEAVEAMTADLAPDQTAELDGSPSADTASVVQSHAPEADPLAVEQAVVVALDQQGSATWPYFKGEYLHPSLQPPFGQLTPSCENNWCLPDLFIADYNTSNYCSGVPDLWFKWPCYQHDLGYTFIPRTSSSSSPVIRLVSSFLAVNTQWYSQMRHECDEQIRGYGPTWIFCQLVALTYFVAVTLFSFPIFAAANGTTGYDALGGPPADTRKPPVFLRWHGCTGPPLAQVGFTAVGGSATVPRGSTIYLTGRTHRSTRALFEFRDGAGNAVANHLTNKARTNCIIHHEPEAFSTNNLPVGTYQVVAWFYSYQGDGTFPYDEATGQVVAYGRPTFAPNVLTLTVTEPVPPPPPPPPDPCWPSGICP